MVAGMILKLKGPQNVFNICVVENLAELLQFMREHIHSLIEQNDECDGPDGVSLSDSHVNLLDDLMSEYMQN